MTTDTLTDADVRDLTSGPGWHTGPDGTRWRQCLSLATTYYLFVGACGTPEADYAWWVARGRSSVADGESGVLRTRADLERVLAASSLDELRAIGGAQ